MESAFEQEGGKNPSESVESEQTNLCMTGEMKKEDIVPEIANLLGRREFVVYWKTMTEQEPSLCETFHANTEWTAQEESVAHEAVAFLDSVQGKTKEEVIEVLQEFELNYLGWLLHHLVHAGIAIDNLNLLNASEEEIITAVQRRYSSEHAALYQADRKLTREYFALDEVEQKKRWEEFIHEHNRLQATTRNFGK